MKSLLIALGLVLSFSAQAQIEGNGDIQDIVNEQDQQVTAALNTWTRVIALCRGNAQANVPKRCGAETSRKIAEIMRSETAVTGFAMRQYGETRTPAILWKKAVVDIRYLSTFQTEIAMNLKIQAVACRNIDNSMTFECATGAYDSLQAFFDRAN